jgi:hypothetical protein
MSEQPDGDQDYQDQDSEATNTAPAGERPVDRPTDEAAPESRPDGPPAS